MSIEREQTSTAFGSMPHLVTFDVKPQPIDELTGTFNALNETTNVRPSKGESISICHGDAITGPIGSLSETFGDGDPRILGPISGEGVFKPQDIDARGSVIVGDNHFTPDRGGDSLMGDRNPGGPIGSKIWTNGGASTFEDRVLDGGFDANDFHACPWKKTDQDLNDVEFGMRQNIGSTAGPGGSTFMTETFEPAAGMNSFGESLKPVLEVGGNAGPGGSTFMTGQFEMPTNNITGSASPGGDDV